MSKEFISPLDLAEKRWSNITTPEGDEVRNIIHIAQSLRRFIDRADLSKKSTAEKDLVLELLKLKIES